MKYRNEIPYAGGTIIPRFDFSHTDASFSNIIQTDYYRNDPRNIANISLTYDKDDWNVQLFINNVNEDLYIASARSGWIGYGAPRTYGIRARMNF